MGSSSKVHGLHAIKSRQPHGNPNKRARGAKLVANKKPLLDEVKKTLADTPEVA